MTILITLRWKGQGQQSGVLDEGSWCQQLLFNGVSEYHSNIDLKQLQRGFLTVITLSL